MNYRTKRHFCTTFIVYLLQISTVISLLIPTPALGKENIVESEKELKNKSLLEKLSFTAGLSYTTNGYKKDTDSNTRESGVSLTTNFATDSGFNIGMINEAYKEIGKAKESGVGDIYLYLSKGLGKTKYVSFSTIGYGIIPLSKSSKKGSNLKSGIIITPSATVDLKAVGLKYLSYTLSISHGRLFHKYYTTTTGSSNTKYYYKLSNGLSYTPTERFSISYGFNTTKATTYHGTRKYLTYGHSFSVSTDISKQVSLNVGLANKGELFKENGVDENIKFIDKDTTLYSLGINYNF